MPRKCYNVAVSDVFFYTQYPVRMTPQLNYDFVDFNSLSIVVEGEHVLIDGCDIDETNDFLFSLI